MKHSSIIRAWKEPAYRNSLSAAERAALPDHPAGAIELSDADLGRVAGGAIPIIITYTRTIQCTLFIFLTC